MLINDEIPIGGGVCEENIHMNNISSYFINKMLNNFQVTTDSNNKPKPTWRHSKGVRQISLLPKGVDQIILKITF